MLKSVMVVIVVVISSQVLIENNGSTLAGELFAELDVAPEDVDYNPLLGFTW